MTELLLFPRLYMSEGAQGPAVKFLQRCLRGMGFNDAIEPDGDYCAETAVGVIRFQKEAGFPEGQQDGMFGPQTRDAFFEMTRIDVDCLPRRYDEGETIASSYDIGLLVEYDAALAAKGNGNLLP